MHAANPAPRATAPELWSPFSALLAAHASAGKASPARRSLVGVGVAAVLHAALLAVIVANIGELHEAITPPQPYLTVSLVSPSEPKPTPAPHPQPVKAQPSKPTPVIQPKPVSAARPAPQTVLSAAAATGNPVETSAPIAQAAPAAPPAPGPAREAPVAIVPPKFDAAYLSNPAPPYPSASRRMGEEGRVLLKVHVGADGHPLEVSVVQSSGFQRLDDAARDTVLRSWRFVPARQGEQAVAGSVKVPIIYTLNSAS